MTGFRYAHFREVLQKKREYENESDSNFVCKQIIKDYVESEYNDYTDLLFSFIYFLCFRINRN